MTSTHTMTEQHIKAGIFGPHEFLITVTFPDDGGNGDVAIMSTASPLVADLFFGLMGRDKFATDAGWHAYTARRVADVLSSRAALAADVPAPTGCICPAGGGLPHPLCPLDGIEFDLTDC